MNYERIYQELIQNAREHPRAIGEKHHIMPVSLGGPDDLGNKVKLTMREHFLAHALLTKFTTGMDRVKMLFAFGMMSTFSKSNSMRASVSSRLFEQAKLAAKLARKELMKQPEYISPVRGTKWYTDGERRFRLRADDPVIELLRLEPTCGASKGLRWFTDGVSFCMLSPEEGERRGLTAGAPSAGVSKHFSDEVKQARRQMLWFNDGIKSTKLRVDDPRVAGLVRGRLITPAGTHAIVVGARWPRSEEDNKANRERQKGSRWWNDGTKNFIIRPQEPVPAHFQRGRLRRHHSDE